MKQTVKFKKLTPNAIVPTYGTEFSAGADLYSGMTEPVIINAGTTEFIKTGIAMEIPEGLVGLVYARSGMACKKGLAPANKVGVIVTVEPGDRIAQLVLTPYITAEFVEAEELSDTVRGDGGFGSTGTK